MTALKAFQVEKFIAGPDLDAGFILIYGTDAGLVHERAMKLMRHYGGGDSMSEITLDAGTVSSDPERLAVEARTASLFGGNQVIRVREAGNGLVPTLEEMLADWPDAIVIAEAGNLTPKDRLRVLAEKSPKARTLPSYADSQQDLSKLIENSFQKAGIALEPGTVPTLTGLLGNDREVSRWEIEKLILFANESKYLSVNEVLELCGDNTASALDQIVDSTATGHVARLEASLNRAFSAGTEANRIMAVALNHFSSLRQMRVHINGGQSAGDVIKYMRPRPHFSRQKSIEQQLRLWNDQALSRACARIYSATSDIRKTGQLPDTLARRALLAICINAAQR